MRPRLVLPRLLVCALALAGAPATSACSEQPTSDIQPIQFAPRPGAEAEEPAEVVVSPHLRRRDLSEAERAHRERVIAGEVGRPGGGGVGGGGGRFGDRPEDWVPRRPDPPTAREVEEFRRRLDRENAARVEPSDDACDQYRDRFAAGLAAAHRPGDPSGAIPSREEMRRMCRAMGATGQRCLDPVYFREHLEECQQDQARQARQGERITARAREQRREMEQGILPGSSRRHARDQDDDEPPADLEIVDQEIIEP
jgi:hypothetical protein